MKKPTVHSALSRGERMMSPGTSFAETIALIAAELADLGKRPVSSGTHGEISRLRGQLDALVDGFVLCDGCGGMYPFVVQLTVNGRAANLCKSCAITAVQREAIELSADRSSHGLKRSQASRRKPAHKGSSPSASAADEDEPVFDDEGTAPTPVDTEPPATEEPTTSAAAAATEPAQPELERAVREPTASARVDVEPKKPSAETATDDDVTSAADDQADDAPVDADDEGPRDAGDPTDYLPSMPRRTAKRATTDEPVFKASVADVARHTGLPTRDVRLISKFVEEISPPMDVAKSTRYVMAELRNIKSKIPADVVPRVVATLKEGIPASEGGNGSG